MGEPNAQKVVATTEGTPLTAAGAGKWRTGRCGFYEDCCICCSVACCHPITTGQLYERTAQKGLINRLATLSCISIAIFLFVCEFIENFLSSASTSSGLSGLALAVNAAASGTLSYDNLTHAFDYTPEVDEEAQQAAAGHVTGAWVMATLSQALSLASMICVCAIVCTVRGAVRRRENIEPECCGDCEDCCCAFCCNPCTQCMLLRHEKLGAPGEPQYQICSPTGLPV